MTTAQYPHRGMTLLDHIAELTRPHQHREHYVTEPINGTRYTKDHVTRVPPLLTQLRYASPSGMGEERAGAGFESRPAASLEALDTLTRIEHEATAWWQRLAPPHVRQPHGLDALVTRLGALHAGITDPKERRALERDVKRWWAQARVVTGWDSASWRPANSCPICGKHGSLRVRFAEKVGLCAECGETWTPETIGLLADHIRAESAEVEQRHRVVEACWCPWPRPPFTFGRWGALCPVCGRPECHRAKPVGGRMSA